MAGLAFQYFLGLVQLSYHVREALQCLSNLLDVVGLVQLQAPDPPLAVT